MLWPLLHESLCNPYLVLWGGRLRWSDPRLVHQRVTRWRHAPQGRRRPGRHLVAPARVDDRFSGRHRLIPRLDCDGDWLGGPTAPRAGGGRGDAHRADPHLIGAAGHV